MSFIKPQKYTVRRRTVGGYVNGVYKEASDITFIIKGGVQPISGKELDLLDEQEGVSLRGSRVLYTKSKKVLRTIRQDGPTRPDMVEIDDGDGEGVELWEVHFSNNRGPRRYNTPASHFKYILQRADEQNDINP